MKEMFEAKKEELKRVLGIENETDNPNAGELLAEPDFRPVLYINVYALKPQPKVDREGNPVYDGEGNPATEIIYKIFVKNSFGQRLEDGFTRNPFAIAAKYQIKVHRYKCIKTYFAEDNGNAEALFNGIKEALRRGD